MIQRTSTFRIALILGMHTMNLLFTYRKKKAEDPIEIAYSKKAQPSIELAVKV